ncbi:uncharacterized protein TOT_040000125 [Theileria orientalis strain Shintoku]|uniref:Uncharacterized protein n=1 Tax=Theileria orientalis strain Shintoku TaxID=869250 RepID=J4C914_THEOR|nr:uncharacterized protein TOT_040000125 [Theileria orientalis strain Shintoku]PVC53660.1 hypothetical protein MACL_00003655 [Theileria orientalis]BAM41743.1 uncharacterized protein TOT_040000125 [Theileria orientalis strain Shintoku]|eukprot:XP_009692044.1 uncharacterized protein TOT_040000125 [Theileria orientalis strain Shintoku]
MADKNLNSHSESFYVDSTKTFSKDATIVEEVLGKKELEYSFEATKLSKPIEVLTTTDSNASDLQESYNSSSQTSNEVHNKSEETEFLLIDDSEFPLNVDEKVVLLSEPTHQDRRSLFSLFGYEFSLKLCFYMIIFVLTNTAQPLLIVLLKKNGGTPKGTYTFLLPTYLAMVCVGFYPTKKTIFQENWKYPILLSLLDLLHQVIEKAGLIYCGPSIYSIASSTNTLFLALFSKVVLKQTVTSLTWLSVSLISFSLAMSGFVQIDYIDSQHILGFMLVTLASLVSALNSIIGESLLKQEKIEGPNLVCMMGLTSLSVFSAWSVLWTFPKRRKLFATDADLNPFDLKNVVSILLALLLSNFGRSSVYYYIIKNCGSVCCGVLKALRIFLIILMDHYLFNFIDGGQKLSLGKFIAALICTVGVISYSIDRSDHQFKNKSE